MAEINILENNFDKNIFNSLANHPMQSWGWGEFRKKQGLKVIRIGKEENNIIKEVFQTTFHPIPLIPQTTLKSLTIGYLPKSPLPDKETLEELKKIGKENKAIFIKIEPNVEANIKNIEELKKIGLIAGKPLFTKYTSVIDLSKTEEEILSSFKNKTRYNIHVAEKHGVSVREDNSPEAFNKYLDLLFETTNRQGFFAHNRKYHQEQWNILSKSGISHLLIAECNGKILSAFLLFVFNNVLYYPYGASTRESREVMAPTKLMWEAIKFGKKMGCKSFDLWGDTEPNPPPNHPYFGFHRFKEGFSPRLVEFVGTYDLVINPTLYQSYKAIEQLRWKLLRLKSKLKF